MDRWYREAASRFRIRNILIREGLAECLGTFMLVVSSKTAVIRCVERTGKCVVTSFLLAHVLEPPLRSF